MSSSFGKGQVNKGKGPMGSKIVPEQFNGSASGQTVGGFEDGKTRRSMLTGPVAKDGAGRGAAQTSATPDQKAPTPAPGKPAGAKPNPLAPASLRRASEARGSAGAASGESTAKAMASTARRGGRIGLGPTAQKPPALPAPRAAFPSAAPFKSPLSGPSPRGRMDGTMPGSGKA